jgi:hypothetical protein
VKIEIEIPDDSLAVPMVVVTYVDKDKRLQATLQFQPVGVPLIDCCALVDQTLHDARARVVDHASRQQRGNA